MKPSRFILLITIALAFAFTSCEEEATVFDEGLLIGKWLSLDGKQTEYYRYDTDYTGAHWDTSEDVTEEEGLPFEWTLVKDDLTHFHLMQMGGNKVPKFYKVVELTESSLKYKDDFDKTYSFVKVKSYTP